MPVYKCSVESCPNQYTDGTPKKKLYCSGHRHLEPKADIVPNSEDTPVDMGSEVFQTNYSDSKDLGKHTKIFREGHERDLGVAPSDRELGSRTLRQDAGADLKLVDKIEIQLTKQQIVDIREAFKKEHNDCKISLRPVQPPYPTEYIASLEAKQQIASNALIRIKTKLPSSAASTGLTTAIGKLINEAIDEMAAV